MVYSSGNSRRNLGVLGGWPPQGNLTMSGDNLVVTSAGGGRETYYWYLAGRGQDAAKHPTMSKTVLYNKILSGLKCQQCQAEKFWYESIPYN